MQFIDLVLSASEVTALHEVVDLLPPAAGGSVQLERPEKVGSVLEVGTNVENLVNQILDTDDSELAELVLGDVIGCNGSAITVHLDKSTLVDQIADRLEVRRSPGDVGLLLSLMKTPLLICLSRKSCSTFFTLGETWLIPRILITKASLGSAGT